MVTIATLIGFLIAYIYKRMGFKSVVIIRILLILVWFHWLGW